MIRSIIKQELLGRSISWFFVGMVGLALYKLVTDDQQERLQQAALGYLGGGIGLSVVLVVIALRKKLRTDSFWALASDGHPVSFRVRTNTRKRLEGEALQQYLVRVFLVSHNYASAHTGGDLAVNRIEHQAQLGRSCRSAGLMSVGSDAFGRSSVEVEIRVYPVTSTTTPDDSASLSGEA